MLTKYYDTMLTNTRDIFDPFKILDEAYLVPLQKRSTLSNYRVNVINEDLELSIDLPGLKAKDLTVQTSGRDVKIMGKVRGEDLKYTYRISKDYDPASADALLEDGVLTLKFQRLQQAPTKTVHVKS